MTDLATTLADLATLIDRIGVTHADVISTHVWDNVYTFHVHDTAADRIVPTWGDMDTLAVDDYRIDGVTRSHHHRVAVNGTGGKVVLLWVTRADAHAA